MTEFDETFTTGQTVFEYGEFKGQAPNMPPNHNQLMYPPLALLSMNQLQPVTISIRTKSAQKVRELGFDLTTFPIGTLYPFSEGVWEIPRAQTSDKFVVTGGYKKLMGYTYNGPPLGSTVEELLCAEEYQIEIQSENWNFNNNGVRYVL